MQVRYTLSLLLIIFCALTSINAQNLDILQANKQLKVAQEQLDTLNYETAIELGKQALATAQQLILPVKIIQALVILGDAHREQGEYDTALTYYQNAKQQALEIDGQETAVAQADNDMGLCYWKKRDLQEAVFFFGNALNIRIAIFGEQHPKVADSYNNLGNCAFDQRDLNTARDYYEKALTIRLSALDEKDPDVASSYNNLGTVYRFAGQFETAIDYYTKSINIREDQLGKDHPKVAQSCNNLGQCYEQMGDYETAINYFKRSSKILLQHYEEKHPDIATAYLGIGSCYSKSNNHSLALRYFEKALAIQQAKFDKNSPNLISVYNNLANSYKNLGDYNKAMLYYDNNLHILNSSLGANHPFTAATHNNIGLIQVELVQFENALKNYRQALSIYEQQQDLSRIADSWNNIGTCFRQQKFFKEAIQAYQRSIAIYQQLTENVSNNKATAYYNIGNCLGEEGSFEEAINYYNRAINLIDQTSNSATLAIYKTSIGQIYYKQGAYPKALNELDASLKLLNVSITDSNQIESIQSPMEVLNLLNTKAKTLYALSIDHKDSKGLTEVLANTDFSIRLIDQLRQQYQEDYSKRKLSETTYDILYLGIAACHLLYQENKEKAYLKKAFNYSEKSRSNLILEAIAHQRATAFANIPDSLLALENQLKTSIADLEKQQEKSLAQAVNNKPNNQLFEQKQAYNKLIQQFETDYPSYHKLKYDHTIIAVDNLQKELTKQEAFLEYFVRDTSVYIFLINQDDIHLEVVAVDSLLKEVELFREGISRYYMDLESQTEEAYRYYLIQYLRSANFLYQKLIAPVEKLLPEKITIVNSGVLNYIPFDALVSQLPEKTVHRLRDIDYLVKSKEINYAYSATLQFQQNIQSSTPNPENKILALAPTFTIPNRLGLAPLAHTSKEVQLVKKILPESDIFIGKDATKSLFIDQAEKYQLLHLATHGKSDIDLGDYSFLAFADNLTADKTAALLYAKDIYNLSINADLVILSACETGKGELAQGEGVVSLARAFFYAGATSVVTTLWSINDASTKNIIHSFYQNLNQGLSKGAALRKAKLQYIENADDPNPFFWAAFTLTGQNAHTSLFSSSESIETITFFFGLSVLGLLMLTFFFEKIIGENYPK